MTCIHVKLLCNSLCCHAAAAIDTTPDDAEATMSTFVDGGIIANNPTMQVSPI